MDPKHLFADSRLTGFCVYCGGPPETRDHVPARVFLDDPFPENLPVVECCGKCSSDFSAHEEYFACFLCCVLDGSTSPDTLSRSKVARIMQHSPALAKRIESSLRHSAVGEPIWTPELERIKTVVLKLARGHIAYELSLPRLDEPESIHFTPLPLMSSNAVEAFLSPQQTPFWPEIGSRAFIRACRSNSAGVADSWTVVQPGRYQYLVSQADGDFVRLLIGDYLACAVHWD